MLAGLVGVGAVAVLGSMVARPSAPARHVVPPVPVTTPVLVVVPGAPVASVPEEPVVVAPPALPTVPSALPAAPSPSPAGALPGAPHSSTLTIVATEQAWVQVVVDGAAPVEATLRPGERAAWQGRSFDIVVGNAGGVTLDLDGVPQPPLGESGRRAALTLPRR